MVEIRSGRPLDKRSGHRASFREFLLGKEGRHGPVGGTRGSGRSSWRFPGYTGERFPLAAAAAPPRRAHADGRRADEGLGGGRRLEVGGVAYLRRARSALIEAFRTRPLVGEHRYVWVDARYHKVRADGHVTSQATVVAVGRDERGRAAGPRRRCRAVGPRLWTAFLRGLVKRGLCRVRP